MDRGLEDKEIRKLKSTFFGIVQALLDRPSRKEYPFLNSNGQEFAESPYFDESLPRETSQKEPELCVRISKFMCMHEHRKIC